MSTEAVKKLVVDNQLRDNILIEIAKAYPYSIDDIRIVYDTVQSFDTTIKVCETALDLGMASPLYIVNLARSGLPDVTRTLLFPKVK